MATKFFALVCSVAIFNVAAAQVIKLPFGLPLDLTPNQVFINSPLPCGVDTILSAPVTVPATTTIIQDSTVANNLANALQLLVVSNLLSNTLPCMGPEVVVPCASPVVASPVVDIVSPLSYGLPAGYSFIF